MSKRDRRDLKYIEASLAVINSCALPGWIQEPSSPSLFLLKCYSISSQLNLHLRSSCAFLVLAVPIGRLFLPLFVLMASNLHLISRLSLVTYGFK